MKRVGVAALAVAMLAAVAGCGSDDDGGDESSGGEETTLTVYAAASLTAAFDEIGADFESSHDGVTRRVQLSPAPPTSWRRSRRARRRTCSRRPTRPTWRSSLLTT